MAQQRRGSTPGQQRVQKAALALFAHEGVAATSLQMIADAMGVTKAAVYWHYRSKEEIVLGVLEPALDQLRVIVESAEGKRAGRARTDAALRGIIDLVVAHRELASILLGDPALAHLLRQHRSIDGALERLLVLLGGCGSDPGARIAAELFLHGLAGLTTVTRAGLLSDDVLRDHLYDAGRRLLLSRRSAA